MFKCFNHIVVPNFLFIYHCWYALIAVVAPRKIVLFSSLITHTHTLTHFPPPSSSLPFSLSHPYCTYFLSLFSFINRLSTLFQFIIFIIFNFFLSHPTHLRWLSSLPTVAAPLYPKQSNNSPPLGHAPPISSEPALDPEHQKDKEGTAAPSGGGPTSSAPYPVYPPGPYSQQAYGYPPGQAQAYEQVT